MNGFQLLGNFIEDPKQLLRNTRHHKVHPQRFISNLNPFQEGGSAPPPKESMAQKMISNYSALSATNVAMGPQFNLGDATFELKLMLINMVQLTHFVESLMRMLMPTFNTSWRCVAPSLSRV